MLNNIYLESKLTQRSIIDHETAAKFVNSLDTFLQEMTEEKENLGTTEVVDVLSLLITLQDYFSCTSEWEDLVYVCLTRIRDNIYSKKYSFPAAFSGLAYVAFITRELANVAPDLKSFLRSIETLLCHDVHRYCNPHDINAFHSTNSYELISGMSGMLKYFLEQHTDSRFQNTLHELVEAFIARSCAKQICGHTLPGWHYYPSTYERKYMETPALNGCVNYGVSHGMGGPLAVLSQAYARNINTEMLLSIITDLISEYMNSYYYRDSSIHWPGRITFEEYVDILPRRQPRTRNSWCYGSAGILRALYLAAKAISDTRIETFALEELEKIAQEETSNYLLSSPIVCHGLAGMALILHNMYLDSGHATFQIKVSELCQTLVNDFLQRNHSEIPKYSYLEGYTGILQTILTLLTGQPNVNKKRLLIV